MALCILSGFRQSIVPKMTSGTAGAKVVPERKITAVKIYLYSGLMLGICLH